MLHVICKNVRLNQFYSAKFFVLNYTIPTLTHTEFHLKMLTSLSSAALLKTDGIFS